MNKKAELFGSGIILLFSLIIFEVFSTIFLGLYGESVYSDNKALTINQGENTGAETVLKTVDDFGVFGYLLIGITEMPLIINIILGLIFTFIVILIIKLFI
jgi:hypothetical protein